MPLPRLTEGQRLFEEGADGNALYLVIGGGCRAICTIKPDPAADEDAAFEAKAKAAVGGGSGESLSGSSTSGGVAPSPSHKPRATTASGGAGAGGAGAGAADSKDGVSVSGSSGSSSTGLTPVGQSGPVSADGKREFVAGEFKENDCFGEISLFLSVPRTASIVCHMPDTLLLELRRSEFVQFLKLLPNVNTIETLMRQRTAEQFKKLQNKMPIYGAIPPHMFEELARICKIEEVRAGRTLTHPCHSAPFV
jgi:hypothetical protein